MSTGSGAALLVDIQRRMTLFAEAVSGRSVLLAPIGQLEQHYRVDAFSNDGKHYWLPEIIDDAPDFATNYAHYRVALIHQIGYQIHGTFCFDLTRFYQLHPEMPAPVNNVPEPGSYHSRSQALDLERLFSSQAEPELMRLLFSVLEGWRVDLQNYRQFPGLRADLTHAMALALAARPAPQTGSQAQAGLEALIRLTLRAPGSTSAQSGLSPTYHWIAESVRLLTLDHASVYDTAAAAVTLCRRLSADGSFAATKRTQLEPVAAPGASQLPVPSRGRPVINAVHYRGEAFALPAMASRRRLAADAAIAASSANGGTFQPEPDSQEPDGVPRHVEPTPATAQQPRERHVLIDEWDYLNQQTLRGWCCLKEYRLQSKPGTFMSDLLKRYKDSYEQIKRQFNTLRPEAIRLQRGLPDGESIELDRMIERFADRQAGLPGDDRLYQRRDRAERDVAAAFLLDMSASTDFQVADPLNRTDQIDPPASETELDDIGWSPYDALQLNIPSAQGPKRRVIDIARESLGLISAVLQDLGDRFALYAYSGQGRHQVNFGVAKEFDQTCSAQTWGALAAIEPQGSSRMGAPIRHTGAKLAKTVARMKIMMIVSDGYPQDIDYGPDRLSDEYGLQDTARAIEEVSRMGVQVFCLSVDPGGHDYLRRVCAPDSYLVIDEVNDLPVELVKVYRRLTASGRR